MKSITKAALALTLAVLMAFSALPVFANAQLSSEASAAPDRSVPAGYNANDYTKCAAFLEQTDENGVKNGEKISDSYDVLDPISWGQFTFQWANIDGEKRIANIQLWDYSGLVGSLDVSDCIALVSLDVLDHELTALNVSGCSALLYLDCSGNELTELDVSDCIDMIYLYCDGNRLSALDVTMLPALEELDCYDNELSELDVSGCPVLEALYCTGNPMTELDLSHNPMLGGDLIEAAGSGHIGYRFLIDNGEVHARPVNGAEFLGFFDENGNLLDEGFFMDEDDAYVYFIDGETSGTVTARFSGGSPALPGDIDGTGSVSVSDAVSALRLAMGLIDESGLFIENGDMDGNGSVAIADAVVILRIAMGIV